MRQAIRLSFFALGAAIVLASTGCRQIVGFADERNPGPDAGTDAETYMSRSGGWRFADPVCGSCIDRSCAMEAKACALDPSCQAHEECVASCPRGNTPSQPSLGRPCAGQCLSRVPSAVLSPETWPFYHCVAAKCRAACPSSTVTSTSGQTCGPLIGNPDCTSCCCGEFAACDNDPDCVRQIACGRRCGLDPSGKSCFEACTGKMPDPPSAHATLGACALSPRCQMSCGLPDWSCLGHVRWPDPSSGSWNLYGTVYDLDPNKSPQAKAVAGFDVKACIPRDVLCTNPFDEMKTDGDGRLVLDLSKNFFGNTTYFEVTAPIGLDYPPHLFFPANWTLTHSLRYDFFVYLRGSLLSIPLDDPTLGGVLFFTFDCKQSLSRAAGVEVTAIDPPGSWPTTYVRMGYPPDSNATSTDFSGIGFIIHLPPGQVILSAQRHDTGELIGKTKIVIQPGAMTIAELVPTP